MAFLLAIEGADGAGKATATAAVTERLNAAGLSAAALSFPRYAETVGGWALGGATYAGYNIIGAIVILPVTRHLRNNRDAVIAGAIAGPLAMLPALLFFICMMAFMPAIASETLPSDYMLIRLEQPVFHLFFQLMIFAALLESGTGAVHAINERIASAWRKRRDTAPGPRARAAIAASLLIGCMLMAERVGLVALIANGYRALSYILFAVYILPLLTVGLWRLRRRAILKENAA